MKKIYSLFAIVATAFSANAQVIISQFYGGGGNNGAVYTHDFIELFNSGTQTITLTGYSLQYGAATGTSFSNSNIQHLPTITIPAGGYYLIQEMDGANTTGMSQLPNPDLITNKTDHNAVLNLSGTTGRLALVKSTTAITGPNDSNVVDFIGFGPSASQYDGNGAAPIISNSTAAIRLLNGCQHTNNNDVDFIAGVPSPRNSQTPVNICSASISDNNIDGLNIYPNPATDIVTISSNNNGLKSVQLFDLTGKKVMSVETENTINVSGLTKGMYIMTITEAGKSATSKLIIK